MSVKGLVSLLFGLSLVASGIWLTMNQAKHEQQWNLQKDAANGVMAREMPGDEQAGADDTSEPEGKEDSGIVNMLP
ncbi:hypothetical protein SAMN05421848_0595 [Kushneria avicenniae]|uniref:Uncharacterized protein n=1 Tax=Kushneria avicenniae TaxID=402385 RepID=A0A1I1GJ57_9GAMM|nr:hypothetical protein [Kushneria avicenniae]SFC11302.1 hypothetical protein SAMN05421848_0595 [Kushneria avicenniae]